MNMDFFTFHIMSLRYIIRNMTNNYFKEMTIFNWLLIRIDKTNKQTYAYVKKQNF